MVKNRIQPIQMFVLIVLFEVGSAIVVPIGSDAKQDAWIAIIMGMIGGLVLFSLYIYLYTQFPNLRFTDYLEKIIGKVLGRILATVYICLFLYITARILRTFCDLVLLTLLPDTPISALAILIMLVASFACHLGFEVIARTGEIIFPYVMLFSFLFVFFIAIDGLIHFENLQPVLENGWKPVFKAAFPAIVSFPFGESIIFGIFFPYLNKQKNGIIAGYLGMIASGMILTFASIIFITVLGTFQTSIIPYPIMHTIETVNVGGVFQRLDPLGITLLLLGGFFKITIFLCGAIEGFTGLVKKPKLKKFSGPFMAIAVIIMSILMSENWVEHNKQSAKIVPYVLYIPLFMIVPFILVVIVMIKNKLKKKKQAQ